MNNILESIKNRRTYYSISKNSPVSEERVEEVVRTAVKYVPAAFNSDNNKVILLFGDKNQKLWSIVKESLRKIVPADKFAPTEAKIDGFADSFGTVLYYVNNDQVKALGEQMPLYAENFAKWAQHSTGMLQFTIWTALKEEGLGASLQHYAEVIEEEVAREFNVPSGWKMIAQMPFGQPVAEPDAKVFNDVEKSLIVLK